MSISHLRIGTAGWAIPRASAVRFESVGSHLQRYSRHFNCTEINSSFYRPHSISTYAKWRDSTPPNFRFAVKMPRTITHELKLSGAQPLVAAFLEQSNGLAEKRGPVLMQLPPSLAFDSRVASSFLRHVRATYEGAMVCEPRHATWFTEEAESLLDHYRVGRVAADPPTALGADAPGGWPRLVYFRLHGSPRKYWSRYDASYIAALGAAARRFPQAEEVWCVFDNTASGSALENACELSQYLQSTDSAHTSCNRSGCERG